MRARAGLALLVLAAGWPAAGAVPALADAVTGAPALAAARHRVEAARARAGVAGRWADPEVEGMATRLRDPGPGGPRDAWELTVRQPLPRPRERSADRAVALAAVTLAEAEHAAAAGELAAEVAGLLAEAEAAARRTRVAEEKSARLELALRSLETRLATAGQTRLADRLSLETRLASLRLTLAEEQRAAEDAAAAARARLGTAAGVPLPAFSAPEPAEIRAPEAPAIAAARARAGAAEATGRLARTGASAATAVGLRLGRERMAGGAQDAAALIFSSEIPWRRPASARAEARAAGSEQAAAAAEEEAARLRLADDLARVARADRVAAAARAFAETAQARLDAEHESVTRAAAGAGPSASESTVLHAVDILDRAAETRLQVIAADTAARLARAALWRHAAILPVPPVPAPSR